MLFQAWLSRVFQECVPAVLKALLLINRRILGTWRDSKTADCRLELQPVEDVGWTCLAWYDGVIPCVVLKLSVFNSYSTLCAIGLVQSASSGIHSGFTLSCSLVQRRVDVWFFDVPRSLLSVQVFWLNYMRKIRKLLQCYYITYITLHNYYYVIIT